MLLLGKGGKDGFHCGPKITAPIPKAVFDDTVDYDGAATVDWFDGLGNFMVKTFA